MKKKTALLIDGDWFCKGLGSILKLPGRSRTGSGRRMLILDDNSMKKKEYPHSKL
jgi:hypothetical protein